MALTDKLTAIADAIREKTGKTDPMTLDQMPTEILDITTGGTTDVNTADLVDCGKCGDNALWLFYKTGKMQITGSGAMENYTAASEQPWYSYASQITEIVIDNGVTTIGDYAFRECTGLTRITIPDGVTSVGSNALRNCTGLTSITIPDSVSSIGKSAFFGCTGLTSITIPDGVTTIGYYAFQNCTSITSITIPDSVTDIGEYAFTDCSNVKEITFGSGLISIRGMAFRNCTSITSITIPDNVTAIMYMAFNGCSALESIVFGSGLIDIYANAFTATALMSATFAITSGWKRRSAYNSTTTYEISATDLMNPSTAATYLTTTYPEYWHRS